MDMARKILESISEVELDITPEFQTGWPEPELIARKEVSPSELGEPRWRVVYRWPNGLVMAGLEMSEGPEKEFNIWTPHTSIPSGSWGRALKSMLPPGVAHKYPGGMYVYYNSNNPAVDEIKKLVGFGKPLKAYEEIDGYDPGEGDDVIKHFLGYEAEPASTQQGLSQDSTATLIAMQEPGYKPDDVVINDKASSVVMGPELTKFVMGTSFLHVVYVDSPLNKDNPVMILRKQLASDYSDQFVNNLLNAQLWLESTYDEDLKVWKLWPAAGIEEPTFKMYLKGIGYKMSKLVKQPVTKAAGAELTDAVKTKIIYSRWVTVEDYEAPIHRDNGVMIYVGEDPPEVTVNAIEHEVRASDLTWSFTYEEMFWKVWPSEGMPDDVFNHVVSELVDEVGKVVKKHGSKAP